MIIPNQFCLPAVTAGIRIERRLLTVEAIR